MRRTNESYQGIQDHGTLRELSVEKDDLLHRYYLNGGFADEQ